MKLFALLLSLFVAISVPAAAQPLSMNTFHYMGRGLVITAATERDVPVTVLLTYRRIGDPKELAFFATIGPSQFRHPDLVAPEFDPEVVAALGTFGLKAMRGPVDTLVYFADIAPGKYEIYGVRVETWQRQAGLSETFNVSWPFEIKDQATYLGRMSVIGISRPGLFGSTPLGRWVLDFHDEADVDIPLAQKVVPNLGPVVQAPLEKFDNSEPRRPLF